MSARAIWLFGVLVCTTVFKKRRFVKYFIGNRLQDRFPSGKAHHGSIGKLNFSQDFFRWQLVIGTRLDRFTRLQITRLENQRRIKIAHWHGSTGVYFCYTAHRHTKLLAFCIILNNIILTIVAITWPKFRPCDRHNDAPDKRNFHGHNIVLRWSTYTQTVHETFFDASRNVGNQQTWLRTKKWYNKIMHAHCFKTL